MGAHTRERTRAPSRHRAPGSVFLFVVVTIASVQSASGRLVHVAPADSASALGLPSALADAVPGDTLLLAPGTYRGAHTLIPGVSLVGRAGPDSTVLDADGERYVLYGRDVGDSTTIAGLTLRNGRRDHPNSGGGGVYLYQSSPVILNCVFRDHLGYLGPGVYANHRSHPLIAYCVFHGNEGYLGGAIAAYVDCDPLIYNNVIHDNAAVSGGAILALNSAPVIVWNTIVANTAGETGGGAIYLDSSPALIEENVVALNEGSGPLFCIDDDQPPTVRGNTFWRNVGASERSRCPAFLGLEGNHEADPLFIDLAERALWRQVAPDDSGARSAAGARPWDAREPPDPPEEIIDRWGAWREKQADD
jgi:hypothetical protein